MEWRGRRLTMKAMVLMAKYLRLRMRLHGLACGFHAYGIDHEHRWLPIFTIHGHRVDNSITYTYGRGKHER